MFKGLKVLIIVPVYNEGRAILDLLAEIKEYSPFADVVIVNDFSTDNTPALLKENQVQFLSLPANLGIGGAVQTGFKYAYARGYDVAIQVDGDGQHDPRQIKLLLETMISSGTDVVIGSRYLEKTGYKTPVFRRIGMILFSLFTGLITGQKITDTTSGFRALNRKAVEFFAENYPVDFPDAEAVIMLLKNGFKIKEISVIIRQRALGQSTTGFIKSVYYPFRSLIGIFAIFIRERRKKDALLS